MTTLSVRGVFAALTLFVALCVQAPSADAASLSAFNNKPLIFGGFGIAYGSSAANANVVASATRPAAQSQPRLQVVLMGGVYSATPVSLRQLNSVIGVDGGSVIDLDQGEEFGPVDASVVPVPAAAWLFASALGVLGWRRRRQA